MVNSRYQKQIILPKIGFKGQSKISQTTILIVGVGGLGCPVLQYLTSAGVGKIALMDGDKVDISNLQRQVFFSEDDIGKNKAIVAQKKAQKLNSQIQLNVYPEFLSQDNAEDILKNYDLILDCSDNFSTRYLINDICVKLDKTWIFAGISGFQGQLSVCNYQNSATYRCIFPETTQNTQINNCNETGVLGTVAGILGTLQANETLKVILNIGDILANRLLLFDGLKLESKIIKVKRYRNNYDTKSTLY